VRQPFRRAMAFSVAALAVGAGVGPAAAQVLPETLLQQPTVRIGLADGDSAYLLFGAQQSLRTADGHIVVANTGTNQIRVYDGSGRHVRTLGRRGDGPGEFRGLQRIGLVAGDSIAAYDIGLGRITIFAPGGGVARTAAVQPFENAVLPRAFGFTSRGGLLVRGDFDRVFRSGSSRDTAAIAITDAAGVPVRTLGRWPAEEAHTLVIDGFAARRTVAFGRDVFASARGERIVVGTSDARSFDVFFAGGHGRSSTYSQQHSPRRTTRQEVAVADREWLAGLPPQFRSAVESRIRDFPHRDTWPAFGALLAASDGSVWVQDYAAPGSSERRWTVFSPDGRPQRVVRSAQPLTIADAGAGYALAWHRDGIGVERVLLFNLPVLR
jgi:hypothetical protein